MLSIIVKVLSQNLQINLSTTHYEFFILNVRVSLTKNNLKRVELLNFILTCMYSSNEVYQTLRT